MSPIVGEGWWWMKEVCHEGGRVVGEERSVPCGRREVVNE